MAEHTPTSATMQHSAAALFSSELLVRSQESHDGLAAAEQYFQNFVPGSGKSSMRVSNHLRHMSGQD